MQIVSYSTVSRTVLASRVDMGFFNRHPSFSQSTAGISEGLVNPKVQLTVEQAQLTVDPFQYSFIGFRILVYTLSYLNLTVLAPRANA
ncbi:MAG TPA: hypothetical protein VI199_10650 [Novosphingobium sp.]